MQIAANVILILCVPVTLLVLAAVDASNRVSGPDSMGPAFAMVVGGGARYLLLAAALVLMLSRGSFSPIVPWGAIAAIAMIGVVLLVDFYAITAFHATIKADDELSIAALDLGKLLAWGLPLGILALWLVMLNIPAVPSWLARGLVVAIVGVAAMTLPKYTAAVARYAEKERISREAYWAEQARLTAEGAATLAGFSTTTPLERILPFLTEDQWPTGVRGPALDLIGARPNADDELFAMLRGTDDAQRDLAISFLGQMSDPPAGRLADAFVAAVEASAKAWLVKAPALSDAEADKLAKFSKRATQWVYGLTGKVDFTPALSAWDATLAACPQVYEVTDARNGIAYWLKPEKGSTVETKSVTSTI